MLRGIYTGANGMIIQQTRMDVISNNLANVDKTAFKRDTTVFKTFPELLLHRFDEDGVGKVPMGSFDTAPVIGKLGLGGEVNEVYTRFEQGAVKKTENPFDLMLQDKPGSEHPAFFSVMTNRGERLSRSGAFVMDTNGFLVTPQGFPLLGENGPIRVARGNFLIKENGEVWINGEIGNDPVNGTSIDKNRFETPVLLDKIKIRTVENPRHLDKEGDSFYADTPESGEPIPFDLKDEPSVLQGYLEASNVSVVTEMVEMIEVNRSYEANQKTVQTQDSLLGKLINEVLR
ncbi:flagellar hook-basal body protein [Leptospira interrogans]|uniref:flagellar hook-basal body protein n=1 Tax=Leptospira interrogans TaxID=173 RepID=UPI0002BC0396|nr:flagellar hook-basal body protein [Leptospira interrogans]MCR8649164.1 flagellar biosynthesis protein FlgC [Leptospira interrogans serovar Bataviae]OAM86813.1 flagellar biosynthesis protein FlgC [Leptospira interrogans serovar Bataviae]QOI38284.1 flagellar hook-basal body protein [Leptospira interrogans serovar Bataviae]QYY61840.1 flagellar hook-basal body protein [Leptospira interrogans serovar Bataviae]